MALRNDAMNVVISITVSITEFIYHIAILVQIWRNKVSERSNDLRVAKGGCCISRSNGHIPDRKRKEEQVLIPGR